MFRAQARKQQVAPCRGQGMWLAGVGGRGQAQEERSRLTLSMWGWLVATKLRAHDIFCPLEI